MLGLLLCTLAAAAEPLRVDSSHLQLAFDAETGDLVRLAEAASGFETLAAGRSPTFQLQLADAERQSRWVDSRSARSVVAERRADGHTTTLTLRYLGLEEGLDATVTVQARSDRPDVRFRLEVRNDSALIVETAVFPLLRLKRPLGDSAGDDCLFVPGGDGYVARAEALERQRWHYRGYPGPASMQLAAYYDDTVGLSVICEDTQAEAKLLGAGVEDACVSPSIWFQRPFVPGAGFASPWVVVRPCVGSWMDAADDYRAWAREQWWARPKRGEAAPPWLAASPLVLSAEFRPLGNGRMFVPLERWAEFARLWREATGADSVMIEARNWERFGYYVSPDYFPLYPSPEVVAQTIGAAHAAGAHLQAMVASLKWVLSREPYSTPHYNVLGYDGRARFEQEGRPVCVVGRDGAVLVEPAYFTWDGDHGYLCPATEFAREHFRRTARGLAEAGFDLFEFDQMNGGGCPPCYSTKHGHPPGYGPWVHQAVAELMRITREEGRRHNPEFGLSLEDPAELLLPYLDTYISRANEVLNWPGAGPGSRVVPAFAYVYHPLLASTNVDIQHTSRRDDFVLLRTARAFVSGGGLSTTLTPWQVLADYGEDDLFPSPGKMDPDQLTLLRRCVRTHDGPGRSYLTRGEMLQAMAPEGRAVRHTVTWQTGTESEEVTVEEPAVLHSAWSLGDGGVAFVYVNCTREPVRVAVGHETGDWSADGRGRPRVYVNAVRTHRLDVPGEAELPALSTLLVEWPPVSEAPPEEAP